MFNMPDSSLLNISWTCSQAVQAVARQESWGYPLVWRHVVTDCQAAKTAADVTESAASEAGEAANENNALESTSKAAVAAWRASQARPCEHLPNLCSVCVGCWDSGTRLGLGGSQLPISTEMRLNELAGAGFRLSDSSNAMLALLSYTHAHALPKLFICFNTTTTSLGSVFCLRSSANLPAYPIYIGHCCTGPGGRGCCGGIGAGGSQARAPGAYRRCPHRRARCCTVLQPGTLLCRTFHSAKCSIQPCTLSHASLPCMLSFASCFMSLSHHAPSLHGLLLRATCRLGTLLAGSSLANPWSLRPCTCVAGQGGGWRGSQGGGARGGGGAARGRGRHRDLR